MIATTTQPSTVPAEALLLSRRQAADLCGLSTRSFDRAVVAGRTPRPVRIGRRVLWRRVDLKLWVELGCPPRAEFEARQRAK
jgi:predicted DNA-binding transcriptional regulator AlpA